MAAQRVMRDESCICPGKYETDARGEFVRNKRGRRIYHHHPDCRPHDPRLKSDRLTARQHLVKAGAAMLPGINEVR